MKKAKTDPKLRLVNEAIDRGSPLRTTLPCQLISIKKSYQPVKYERQLIDREVYDIKIRLGTFGILESRITGHAGLEALKEALCNDSDLLEALGIKP